MVAILGVDLGKVRVGLSLCHNPESSGFALPLSTVPYKKAEEFAQDLLLLSEEQKIEAIVMGLPLNEDGSEGGQARFTKGYAEELSTYLPFPVMMWDERYSTAEAAGMLTHLSRKKKRKKTHIDSVAAQIILQSYLDNHRTCPNSVLYNFQNGKQVNRQE